MPHDRVIIVYATTSGSTRMVVNAMSQVLPAHKGVVTIDLSKDIRVDFDRHDIVIFGTPTYGRGDCHYLWHEASAHVLARVEKVSLFCLGDSRSHAETFGGGLVNLADLVRAAGVTVLCPKRAFAETCAPGKMTSDGIILDFKRDRHGMRAAAEAWIKSVYLEAAPA